MNRANTDAIREGAVYRVLLRRKGLAETHQQAVEKSNVSLVVGPMKPGSLTYLTALEHYRLVVVHMDIGDLFIVNEWLEHAPTHEIFLKVNDDMCTFKVVYGLRAFPEYSVNGGRNGRLCYIYVAISREIELAPEFPASFPKDGARER
jgi:hypothetical protein